MPATLDRDMLPRMGVFTCRGSLEVIAGREEGQSDGAESGWTKTVRDRLETVQMDGQVRQSVDRWRVVDGQVDYLLNCPRSYPARGFIPWMPLGSQSGCRTGHTSTRARPLRSACPRPPGRACPKAWGCQEG